QNGATDEGVADEVDVVDFDHGAFGNVEDDASITRLVAFNELALGEQPALFLVAPHDRLAGQGVLNRVQRAVALDAGYDVEIVLLEVLGALINDFLHPARILHQAEEDLHLAAWQRLDRGLDIAEL